MLLLSSVLIILLYMKDGVATRLINNWQELMIIRLLIYILEGLLIPDVSFQYAGECST